MHLCTLKATDCPLFCVDNVEGWKVKGPLGEKRFKKHINTSQIINLN